MIVGPHTAKITPTFSGFTASGSSSLFLWRWFFFSDNGLGSSTKTERSSEAALWLRFLNPCAQSSAHTPDPTVLHQLCDLWHCNTVHNTHTHACTPQACAQASAHWRRTGTNTCAQSHSAALLKHSTKPELDVVSPNLFDTTVVLLSSRKSA